MAVSPVVLAEPVAVALEPGLLDELPPELQAAISVAAATAASAAVVAREGPFGATPRRLRNLMGTSWWRSPGPRRAPVRATGDVLGVPCVRKIDRMYIGCQWRVTGHLSTDIKQIRRCHPISGCFRSSSASAGALACRRPRPGPC